MATQNSTSRSPVRVLSDEDALRGGSLLRRRAPLDLKLEPRTTPEWEQEIERFRTREPVLQTYAWDVADSIVFPPNMVIVDSRHQIIHQSVRKPKLLTTIPSLSGWAERDLEHLLKGTLETQLHTETSKYVDEPCVLLGSAQAFNYYHWLAEMLPKVDLIRDDLRAGRRLVLPKLRSAFHAQSLEYVGVNLAQCLIIKQPTRFRDLRIVSNIAKSNTRLSSLIDSFYDRYAGAGGNRLYISRADAKTRRLLNEEEVKLMLSAYGFKSVVAGGLSFAEQAHLFGTASVVVGPHGAGLANIVFMPTGAKVVELLPDSFDQGVTSYAALSEERGFDYTMLLCPSNGIGANADFTVVPDELSALLG